MTEQQKSDMAYFQQMMNPSEAEQSIYIVSTDSTLEGALTRNLSQQTELESLQQKGLVMDYNHVGNFLSSSKEQQERLRNWNHFVERYEDKLVQNTKAAASNQGFASGSFDSFYDVLGTPFSEQNLDFFNPLIKTVCASNLVMDSINHVFHVVDVIGVSDDNV